MLRSMKRATWVMLLLAVTPAVMASCARPTSPDDPPFEVGSDGSSTDVPVDLSLPPVAQGLSAGTRVALGQRRYRERLAAQPVNTVSGFVTSLSGEPLEGVRVSIGETTVVTGKDGAYSAAMKLGHYLVSFEHPAYVSIQRSIGLWLGDGQRLDGQMLPRGKVQHLDADKGAHITEGPLTLDFEPGDLAFVDGAPVHGDVEVVVGVIDPRQEGQILAAPAPLEGVDLSGNDVLLQSYGMLEVELQQDGKKVQVRPGETVGSSLDVSAGFDLREGETIPMWHHDTSRGVWAQARATMATIKWTQEGKLVATAMLPHFSAWNYDGSLGGICSTIVIPAKSTTSWMNLRLMSTLPDGTPDPVYNWSMTSPCLQQGPGRFRCTFNVPTKFDGWHDDVYFRLEAATNNTGGTTTNPTYVTLTDVTFPGLSTKYGTLTMSAVRSFLLANPSITAGSWCGTTKFQSLEAMGNIDLLSEDPTATGKSYIPFGYPRAADPNKVLSVGVGSNADPGFASMASNQASSTYTLNADQDTRNEVGSPRDNCLQNSNPAQTDANGNGIGDVCEAWCAVPPGPDAVWYDYDLDGVDDLCDNKWTEPNPSQYLPAAAPPPAAPPAPPSGGGGGCFVAGTPISLADGSTRPIEDVKPGDEVLAYDVDSGRIVRSSVTETFVHPDIEGTVLINGHLQTTANHPFYANGRWVRADELSVGDHLLQLSPSNRGAEAMSSGDLSSSVTGEVAALVVLPGSQTTFNLEVANQHDYFAGGILVHNKIPLQQE